MRWPKGPPHMALNPPSFFVFVFLVFCFLFFVSFVFFVLCFCFVYFCCSLIFLSCLEGLRVR